MKYCILAMLSLFVVCISCGMFSATIEDENYERIADRITARTAKKLQKELGLLCIGTGGGMMGDIYHMSMSFQYFEEVDEGKARDLLVSATQEYLSAINNDKKVRPYLHNYPFTVEGVDISIWSKEPDGHSVPFDKIACFGVTKGVVDYSLDQPGNKPYVVIHKEPYAEALKIVEEQRATEKKVAL